MMSAQVPLRGVVVGAVESTRVAIEAFSRSDWELTLVVTLPHEASGRHSDYVDLAPAASRVGAQLLQTRQINNADTIRAIRAVRPDFIFVIGWSQICGAEFCAIAPGRTIGYHPAAVPRLRGRAVIPWTILLDEKITAGSLFWLDEGVDSGPLLAQHFFHVAPDECASSLYIKHMDVLARMLDEALASIATGSPPRKVQDERCATYSTKRTREDGLIDWRAPAVVIERLVRAVGRPYPGAFAEARDRRITVWRSSLCSRGPAFHALPGQIVDIEGRSIVIQTGDGLLRLEDWEADGNYTPILHETLGKKRG